MKALVLFGITVIGFTLVIFLLDLWYSVFIVGRYYENGGVLNNVLLGGVPLWILIVIVGGFTVWKNWKKENK